VAAGAVVDIENGMAVRPQSARELR
jgi:hypothetical protein